MTRRLKINPTRLLDLLEPYSFSTGPKTFAVDSLTFVRRSVVDNLWESIIVEAQGERAEAVYASVGASVTTAVMYKLLGDVLFLQELGEEVERGWTLIESDSKAVEWERRLAEVGPSRAEEWALKTGPRILKNTEAARQAVSRYLLLLGSVKSLDDAHRMLRSAVSTAVRDDVDRLSECPGAGGVRGTELAYQVAYYTILHYSLDVENGRSFLGDNPANDDELMQRIHILADKLSLMHEPN